MQTKKSHATTPWAEGPQYQEGLQDLPTDVRQALMDIGTKRSWRRGEFIQKQGQKLGQVVVCLKGRFAVMVAGPSGNDTLLRFLTQGEIVGLPAVLADIPAPNTILAYGSADTLHIARKDFINVLTRFPQGAISVAVLLSHRLAELFRYVEMTSHRTLNERVIYALRRLARRNGEPSKTGVTLLKVTQGELATATSASRQRVHLELKRLEAMGLIELGYGQVIIKTNRL
jgi:CRP/FNR family transcriptional regulator, cyclic AMP receptor protein